MAVEICLKIAGVEGVPDGVIIMLLQEKIQLPVTEHVEPFETDELRIVKKMVASFKTLGVGFDIGGALPCCNPKDFRTGLWLSIEDYQKMGKPSVGDILKFKIVVEDDE